MNDLSAITAVGWREVALIFGASLVGSAHCIGMCGPLILGVTAGPSGSSVKKMWAYHLSRLVGYLTLGALVGWAGQGLFLAFQGASFLIIAMVFILVGLGGQKVLFKHAAPRWNHLWSASFSQVSKGLKKLGFSPSIAVGMGSAFLPCGWLHLFLLSALGVGSPLKGAIVLFVFWSGTLPALFFSETLLSWFRSRFGKSSAGGWRRGLPALVCLVIAFSALAKRANLASAQKAAPGTSISTPKTEPSCH